MKIIKILPLFGIILFIYLVLKIGITDIFEGLKFVKPSYLFLSIALVIPYIILQTLNWTILLKKQNWKLDFVYLFKVYLIGVFYGAITPGKAGFILKVSYLADETGESLSNCSVSIILQRVLDFMALSFLAVIGAGLLISYNSNLFLTLLLLFFIIISFFLFFMNEDLTRKFLRIIHSNIVPSTMKNSTKESFNSFYSELPEIKELVFPFLLAIFNWIYIYTVAYIITLSLSLNVPYFELVSILALTTIVILIPITISGFGTREASLLILMSRYNAPLESIILFSFLMYVINTLFPASLGLVFSLIYNRKKI
ncbi:MAG: lysylphosphatidylglycerol synthase transmembrane domain-containing protein [Thermodesulfobacteriota bacterium]